VPKHSVSVFDDSPVDLEPGEIIFARRALDGIIVTNQRLIVGENAWPIQALNPIRTELWFTSIERDILPVEKKRKHGQASLMIWLLLVVSPIWGFVLFISLLFDRLFDVKPRYGYRLVGWINQERFILVQDYRGNEMRRLRRAILFVQARHRSEERGLVETVVEE